MRSENRQPCPQCNRLVYWYSQGDHSYPAAHKDSDFGKRCSGHTTELPELPPNFGQGPQPDIEGLFSVLGLRSKLAELERELTQVREELQLSKCCEAPCGHSSQFCHTSDGGKTIICLICELGKAEAENKRLNQELAELREVLDAKENSEDDINR